MNKKITVLGLAFLSACASAPRRDPAEVAAFRQAQMPSIYALLGERQELGLTSAQVTALDSIAQALTDQNRPLEQRIRAATESRSGGPVRRPRSDVARERFLSTLREIGDNNRRAMEGVGRTLTEEQRGKVCQSQLERFRERQDRFARRGGGRRGSPPGAMGGLPGTTEADSAGVPARFGWSFCPPPPPPTGADSARASR